MLQQHHSPLLMTRPQSTGCEIAHLKFVDGGEVQNTLGSAQPVQGAALAWLPHQQILKSAPVISVVS